MKEIFIDDQYVVISKDDYRMLKEEHALLTKQAAAKASVRMLPRFWMLAFLPYGDGTTKVFFMPSR